MPQRCLFRFRRYFAADVADAADATRHAHLFFMFSLRYFAALPPSPCLPLLMLIAAAMPLYMPPYAMLPLRSLTPLLTPSAADATPAAMIFFAMLRYAAAYVLRHCCCYADVSPTLTRCRCCCHYAMMAMPFAMPPLLPCFDIACRYAAAAYAIAVDDAAPLLPPRY